MVIGAFLGSCNKTKSSDLIELFKNPPEEARPWTYWYWMHGALSKEGISRDLQEMKNAGFGGAYIFTIRAVPEEPLIEPSYHQLSDSWWEMVLFALEEADRVGLQIAYHVSDGFALAGGPWITPELSMQKVVWTEQVVEGGKYFKGKLKQGETHEGYYRDLGVYAFPTMEGAELSTRTIKPKVSTSISDVDASVLTNEDNKQEINSNKKCWIQYFFEEPFIARALTVRSQRADYQSRRLIVQISEDGVHYEDVYRLEPPRMGWQDYELESTFALGEIKSRYFRFLFDPEGSEPGAEDLDPAKWTANLRISGLELFGSPRINQFEGKSGSIWRISQRQGSNYVPDFLYIDTLQLIHLDDYMSGDGCLEWEVPEGKWTIIRMGHTSTGHVNSTGGAAIGLECDKLNPEAVRLQFINWFDAAVKKAGPDLSRVITMFHVDSWECGSQNWSPTFRKEFINRRGYDPIKYLPIMAGIPIGSPEISERFLYDVRETISDLVANNFFAVLKELSRNNGADFSAESLSPVFISDNMEHYRYVNYPMGEFWLRSPSHDKPNDIIDAVSGARMYGHNIVQAESFTQVRIEWDEHPAMLKTIGDRHFALGINRFVFHVFTHNPWMEKKRPGMTLDGIGLYLQPDQTWWKPGFAWFEYITRSQALLQQGVPVVDIAVFTGEEIPRRALLPDRLLKVLPGLMGQKRSRQEEKRLANKNLDTRECPVGVRTIGNMAVWYDWSDPLKGYAYDSFNKDALINLASVKNGKIVLPGGSAYEVLVIPGSRAMMPDGNRMSVSVARRILQLVQEGANIIFEERPFLTLGLAEMEGGDKELQLLMDKLWEGKDEICSDENGESVTYQQFGKGRIIKGAFKASNLRPLQIEEDLIIIDKEQEEAGYLAWNHRKTEKAHIYFLTNQLDRQRTLDLSFRVSGLQPWIYNAVDGSVIKVQDWKEDKKRIRMKLFMEAKEALFIVFEEKNNDRNFIEKANTSFYEELVLSNPWNLTFDEQLGGPSSVVKIDSLFDLQLHPLESIRQYSGAVHYTTEFEMKDWNEDREYFISLGVINNIAEVRLNGVSLGVLWTNPYRVNIDSVLKSGNNQLEIIITNTWRNRLLADRIKEPQERIADYFGLWYIEGKKSIPAGLEGPVKLLSR